MSDFFLTQPAPTDLPAALELFQSCQHFFLPFADALGRNVPPATAAASLIFGATNQREFCLAVKAHDTNVLRGCIRFSNIEPHREAHIDFVFLPGNYSEAGIAERATLRAIVWGVGRYKLKALKALLTVKHAEYERTFAMFRMAGIKMVKGGFTIPELSSYVNAKAERQAYLTLAGSVKSAIKPALKTLPYSLQDISICLPK